MATERQSPDAVLASTNLSGGVTDIDDDPDSPDANWMVASGNNVDTDVRTSFPTPTGNPTVGADLQEFRAWVRQFDTGQTGDPTCRIELWENGVLVRAGSENTITGSGQIVSFTWNANELGTADGSLVECKIVGTKTGGSPSKRNTVDVGAVEWNVTYDTAQNIPAPALAQTYAPVAPNLKGSGVAAISAPATSQGFTPVASSLEGSGIAEILAPVSAQGYILIVPTVGGSGIATITAPVLAQAYISIAGLVELVSGVQEIPAPALAMALAGIMPDLGGSGVANMDAPVSAQAFATLVPTVQCSGVVDIIAPLLSQQLEPVVAVFKKKLVAPAGHEIKAYDGVPGDIWY